MTKKKISRLTQQVAQEFGDLKDEVKVYKQMLDDMIPELKKLMKKTTGENMDVKKKRNKEGGQVITRVYSPELEDSEFALEHCEYWVVDVQWKKEFMKVFQKLHGKHWKQEFRLFLAKMPRVKRETLDAVPNVVKKAKAAVA